MFALLIFQYCMTRHIDMMQSDFLFNDFLEYFTGFCQCILTSLARTSESCGGLRGVKSIDVYFPILETDRSCFTVLYHPEQPASSN